MQGMSLVVMFKYGLAISLAYRSGEGGGLSLLKVFLPAFAAARETAPCAVNEGPVRIQMKCLVPIYIFPEMKLRGSQIHEY
jgi:hypothetical protein